MMSAEKEYPQALSLLMEFADNVTPEQAADLARSLSVTLEEFGRAVSGPGTEVKVSSVSGPASPIRVAMGAESESLPALLLKHSAD